MTRNQKEAWPDSNKYGVCTGHSKISLVKDYNPIKITAICKSQQRIIV